MYKELPLFLSNPEHYQDRDHQLVVGDIRLFTDEERQGWLDARKNFMSFKGWTDGGADWDDYDDNPETIQFLLHDNENQLVAGMRLTELGDMNDAKSIAMLGMNREDVEIDGSGWDLTRLVPGPAMKHGLAGLSANAKLFGAALAYTRNSGRDNDPAWLFAVEEHFFEAFKSYGIEFEPLKYVSQQSAAEGRLVLAAARPLNKTEHLVENQHKLSHAYSSVIQGVDMAGGIEGIS